MNTVRLLVTGGSGFIGTNIIEYYLKKGCNVLSLDTNTPKKKEHQRLWRKVDILDKKDLKDIILEFNPTHVYHLAARTDLEEKTNMDGYKANTEGVENIIEVLNFCSSLKRVVFTSSMYVCSPGYNPLHYEDYSPHTLYGESKVLTEKIIKNKNITNYEWVIIRPTSIWGPWFGTPYFEFFLHVKKRTYFKIKGKTATKTFGFIYNAIHQMDQILFCNKNLVDRKTFYIGDHPGLNINKWADEISRQLHINLFTIPLSILKLGGWCGDFLSLFGLKFPLQSFRVKNMTTDNVISLLEDTLNIAPQQPYSLKDGVSITLEWLNATDRGSQ